MVAMGGGDSLSWGAMKLRHELLAFDTDDGGVELLDLLLQQSHRFTSAEGAELAALRRGGVVSSEIAARLEASMLLEGPAADALRESARHGHHRPAPRPPPAWQAAGGPWELARELPEMVARCWRDPERWRRLAEDRRAGRLLLRAEGFLSAAGAAALRARAEQLPFEDHAAMYARGRCFQEGPSERLEVRPMFARGPLHTLLSHVMGEDLPERIFLRCWRLGAGDQIAVHNDGLHYVTTFSIGLSEGWTAGQGGAIAFGVPGPAGIEATERWLPHLGDLVVFRPTAVSWHGVEPIASGDRMTITGHYVGADYPG